MNSPKQGISQANIHRVVHTLLKVLMLMLTLVCFQFGYIAYSEGEYGGLGVIPIVVGMFFILSKTVFKTRHVRADYSGFINIFFMGNP